MVHVTLNQVSHWITIFAALDEEYDPTYQYTLTDFAFYNIYDHAQIIFEICYDAMQGDKLKEKVRKIGEGCKSVILLI